MDKKYLPSKQFIARLIILAVLAGAAFGIYELALYIKNRSANGKTQKGLVVRDIVQKDSNKNGIADWEETLWGLDPEKNGESNKAFILSKREILSRDATISSDISQSSPENQLLSQEFFAVVVSLQQTGNLDQTAMDAISSTIGDKIVAAPIADIYDRNQVVIKDEEIESLAVMEYYTAYINLNTKYSDKNMGDELSFVATALKNNDQGALNIAKSVGESYRLFAKELMRIPVPSNLASIHLSLANNYEKVAQSVEGLSKLLSDPIVGMKALINYKKYNALLLSDIEKLTDSLN